ncbi:kinase-like domain-containing protein [Baffinella frigidus]|nr:kinase-like domain-containing protein [Cryptophyta sp. CCMP2293]
MSSGGANLKGFSDLEDQYEIIKQLGEGAYGVVVAAKEKKTGLKVAVKKIKDAVEDKEQGKLLLRELKLLRHFRGHENVVCIKDIIESPSGQSKFKDIYIVTDLMDTDLHRIIRSSQDLSDDHVRYFAYQILRGLKYIHSANVMHRDLKPNNLLVNANCDLKICDLGLARLSAELENSFMTVYVVTRWYRAPELLLGKKDYDKTIDMWAVGCILAELLGRKPLFPGKDYVDMLKLQVAKIGNPKKEDQDHVSEKAKTFLAGFPKVSPAGWKSVYPKASEQALDMLDKLLQFNPKKRLTPEEALAHPYMAELHDPEDEPECDQVPSSGSSSFNTSDGSHTSNSSNPAPLASLPRFPSGVTCK